MPPDEQLPASDSNPPRLPGPVQDQAVTLDSLVLTEYGKYRVSVDRWVQQVFPSGFPECPMCHSKDWGLLPMVQMAIRDEMGPQYVGKGLVVAPFVCRVCKFVAYFDIPTLAELSEDIWLDAEAPE